MLRKELCKILLDIKLEKTLTYDKLVEITEIPKSQWIKILTKDGTGVSLERLEYCIVTLGYKLEVQVEIR